MTDPSLNERLIAALQALAARPVTNRKQLAAWKLEADQFEQSLTEEEADFVPQFVWHYLADADIRLRNPGYRADQERQLEQALRELGPRAHKPVTRRRSASAAAASRRRSSSTTSPATPA
jgi:hypothetical protein